MAGYFTFYKFPDMTNFSWKVVAIQLIVILSTRVFACDVGRLEQHHNTNMLPITYVGTKTKRTG